MRLRKPSPSMFVSIAALVVAMGGTSYAAVQISGSDIKNKTITAKDVKKNTLGSSVIKNKSIAKKDLKKNVLPEIPEPEADRWAYVDATGVIAAQSGGFSLVAGYPTLPNTAVAPAPDNSLRANGNVYINAGEELSDNAIIATLTLQNTVDIDGGGMAGRTPGSDTNTEFSGEVTVSRCAFPGSAGIPTNCAPAGAQNATSFVVSPRNSDGSFTTATTRKGFYVIVTGDSSELP